MDIKMRWTVASRRAVKMGIERRRMEGRLVGGSVGHFCVFYDSNQLID